MNSNQSQNNMIGGEDVKDYFGYFYSGYTADISKVGLPPKSVYEEIDLDSFHSTYLIQHLQMMDQMTDYQMVCLIRNNLQLIINTILNGESTFSKYIIKPKFIEALKVVLTQVPINLPIKVAVNKLAYDFNTLPDASKYKAMHQFFELTKFVNQQEIHRLMALDLTEEQAATLALTRYSSMNDYVNAARMNFVIYGMDDGSITQEILEKVYAVLFSGGFTNLFVAIMLDRTDCEPNFIHNENFQDMYGLVGLVALIILNDMPTVDIKTVLCTYIDVWFRTERDHYPRFSLNSIARDGFERVVDVIEELRGQGYVIP